MSHGDPGFWYDNDVNPSKVLADNGAVTFPADVTLSAEHPFRGLAAALAPARPRIAAAVVFFFIKDSPNWVLPVIKIGRAHV